MWGTTAIHTDETANGYMQQDPGRAIKSIKDLISAMKYMQHPAIHSRLVAQKQRIAARLKELDEIRMPAFQRHTGTSNWHQWTSRGLETMWNQFARSSAASAKTKAVDYIEWILRELKDTYDSPTNRYQASQGNVELRTLLGKIDAIEAEWNRYQPISWGNPF
jgi:hypothetical protein